VARLKWHVHGCEIFAVTWLFPTCELKPGKAKMRLVRILILGSRFKDSYEKIDCVKQFSTVYTYIKYKSL